MNIHDKLAASGLKLPEVSTPGGSYASVNIRNHMAFVAIQFPILDGKYLYQGALGADLNSQEGHEAIQLCALNVLAQIDQKVGFDSILGLNHIDMYYMSAPGWDEAPKVADGASELFVNILGEKGIHTRAIMGVHHLPRNFCCGIVSSFTLIR